MKFTYFGYQAKTIEVRKMAMCDIVTCIAQKLIEKGMDSLMENRTTFVIAHRLSTVRDANVIIVLEQGEIIERGSHEELLEMKGRYYELYTGVRELD